MTDADRHRYVVYRREGAYIESVNEIYSPADPNGLPSYCTQCTWRVLIAGSVIDEWGASYTPVCMRGSDASVHAVWERAEMSISSVCMSPDVLETARLTFLAQFMTSDHTQILDKLSDGLLNDENAFLTYLSRLCARFHTGDEPAIRSMFLSYAATKVLNGEGIHISISGDAGTGKSHSAYTAKRFMPAGAVVSDRLSDKALFYHAIQPRTIFLMDDQELTEDMQELIKIASTNWSDGASYMTVNQGKPLTLSLPARCVFWVVKANLNGDEQILDRQLVFWTDNSATQRRAIQTALFEQAAGCSSSGTDSDSALAEIVCKAAWEKIPDAAVVIPYAPAIGCDENMDPRNIKLFLALIQASAIMNFMVRKRDPAGQIIAEYADFETAADIMNPLLANKGGSQRLKLSSGATKILEYLADQSSGIVTYDAVRRHTGFDSAKLSWALHGRDNNGSVQDGLLAVCPALEIVSYTDTICADEANRKTRSRKAIQWNLETYRAWSGTQSSFYLVRQRLAELGIGTDTTAAPTEI